MTCGLAAGQALNDRLKPSLQLQGSGGPSERGGCGRGTCGRDEVFAGVGEEPDGAFGGGNGGLDEEYGAVDDVGGYVGVFGGELGFDVMELTRGPSARKTAIGLGHLGIFHLHGLFCQGIRIREDEWPTG